MYAKYTKQQKIDMIMQCRNSGLSDYQWCKKNGISSSSFYNWTQQLKRTGEILPGVASKDSYKATAKQDVVKLEIIDDISLPVVPDSTSEQSSPVEIIIGKATIRISNDTTPSLLTQLMTCLGGFL